MESKLLMSVEEYLHTSFEDADCDYLDGEVVERNVGEWEHASVQGALLDIFYRLRKTLGIQARVEIRIQIGPRRFRVADVAVWPAGFVGKGIPSEPPFLAIEILSPADRMTRMQPKIQEYLSIGVRYVWLIDPYEKNALVYSRDFPGGRLADVLTTDDPAIEIPLSALFEA